MFSWRCGVNRMLPNSRRVETESWSIPDTNDCNKNMLKRLTMKKIGEETVTSRQGSRSVISALHYHLLHRLSVEIVHPRQITSPSTDRILSRCGCSSGIPYW